jgi:hypothetical protein
MAKSQPAYVSCSSGLILNSNKFELLNNPGAATRLRNFEVALSGGYRRINGYRKFGTTSATKPNGTNTILGIFPYALGVVVCVGTNIYYTEDGISWIQINKDTTHAGATAAAIGALATLSRANQDRAQFALVKGEEDHATNPYGVLYIATGDDPLVHFHIDGTGSGRLFVYTEVGGSAPAGANLVQNFDQHLCVVDTVNEPNKIYYSDTNDQNDFGGVGSGSINVPDHIVGIKSFRDALIVFCRSSIHKLININDSANIAIVPVTGNLGCLDAFTIQEIGGDLVFLSSDGIRTIAATDRLDDVELGTVSRPVQSIVDSISENRDTYTFSSVVLREKNQYRLYYTTSAGIGHGLIATLAADQNGSLSFKWSEIRELSVNSIVSHYDANGVETVYHGAFDGYLYEHDVGNDFDGRSIRAEFKSPDTHFGDLGVRKTLHYLNVSLSHYGPVSLSITPSFDFGSTAIMQPGITLLELSESPGLYGAAIYGTARYSKTADPLKRVPLQGSGSSVAIKFFCNDSNPPFTIHGYHIELFPSGRK